MRRIFLTATLTVLSLFWPWTGYLQNRSVTTGPPIRLRGTHGVPLLALFPSCSTFLSSNQMVLRVLYSCLSSRTHPICLLHTSWSTEWWPVATRISRSTGLVSIPFKCSTACLQWAINDGNNFGCSFQNSLFSVAAARKRLGTNHRKTLHNPKHGRISVWFVRSWKCWIATVSESVISRLSRSITWLG